ncbi:MAG: hypothetical protein H6698_06180 [Myxococcales bacterium]|nr:hypothetical protein [Myxococcales bacterium]MCB9531926.1 hypothetical protein [Myxococcales bacterium]MCB9533894.1 hypothetical protein [Myxococcales bacterium]
MQLRHLCRRDAGVLSAFAATLALLAPTGACVVDPDSDGPSGAVDVAAPFDSSDASRPIDADGADATGATDGADASDVPDVAPDVPEDVDAELFDVPPGEDPPREVILAPTTMAPLTPDGGAQVGDPAETNRARPEYVHFDELRLDGLSGYLPEVRRGDAIDYGWGGGFVDFDGDGDVDVFLGGRTGRSPACIYRNDSEPGEPRLTRVAGWCLPSDVDLVAGVALDLDGGAAGQLLVGGDGVLLVLRADGDGLSISELDAGADVPCLGGSALQLDIDLDGDGDLIVGCQPVSRSNIDGTLALTFLNDHGELVPTPTDAGFDDGLFTLALAGVDVEDDGLPDVLNVVDTFSRPGSRNTSFRPGGLLRRCLPTDRCLFRRERLADDQSAWGSYMGAGLPYSEPAGRALYVADWGANRYLRARDLVPLTGVYGGSLVSDPALFSWGVVVEDFDLDGRDDIFVSRGEIRGQGDPEAHRHTILLQDSGGWWIRLEAGASSESPLPRAALGRPRAAAKVDLDLDGTLELIVVSTGAPTWYREAAPGPRCTLRPHPRRHTTNGWGYATRRDAGDPWRTRDVQGQTSLGTSPYVLTSALTGELRFPSGAVVGYDCGAGHALDVWEPEWLAVEQRGDVVTARVDTPWLTEPVVELIFDGPGGWRSVEGTSGVFEPGETAVYVRLDERWFPLRFARLASAP